jgi:hypothetical protein
MVDNLELKQQFFSYLDERQKRQFAALESNELGYYGVTITRRQQLGYFSCQIRQRPPSALVQNLGWPNG